MHPTITITENQCPRLFDSGISNPDHRLRSQKTSSGRQGFTIIEVLITIFILSVGILAVANLQITAIKGDSLASRLTLASSIAANQAEDISGLKFNDPALDPGDHGPQLFNRFWVGWRVTPDIPLGPITQDTNGQTMPPISISKTIDIIIFDTGQAFSEPESSNRILTLSLVKTRSL